MIRESELVSPTSTVSKEMLLRPNTDGPQLTMVGLNNFSTSQWCKGDTCSVDIILQSFNFAF
jgi:hypothetical protein